MAPRLDFDPSGDFGQYGSQPSGVTRTDFDPSGDFGQYGFQDSGSSKIDYNPAGDLEMSAYSFRHMGQFATTAVKPPPMPSASSKPSSAPMPPPPSPAGYVTVSQVLSQLGFSGSKPLADLYAALFGPGKRYPGAKPYNEFAAGKVRIDAGSKKYFAPVTPAESAALNAAIQPLINLFNAFVGPGKRFSDIQIQQMALSPISPSEAAALRTALSQLRSGSSVPSIVAPRPLKGFGQAMPAARAIPAAATPAAPVSVIAPAAKSDDDDDGKMMKIAIGVGVAGAVGYYFYKKSQQA